MLSLQDINDKKGGGGGGGEGRGGYLTIEMSYRGYSH
jgi:hypothetical protein